MPARSRSLAPRLALALIAGLGLAAGLAPPRIAHAQLVGDGAYLGGSFNATFENFSNTGNLDFGEGLGFGVRAGSRAHPLVAIEAQYEWTGQFDGDVPGQEVDVELHVITANGKLFLFPGRFEPFLMMGMGYGRAEVDRSGTFRGRDTGDGFLFRAGAGAQLGLHESLSLSVDGGFVLPSGELSDLSYFSVTAGVNLHFRGL